MTKRLQRSLAALHTVATGARVDIRPAMASQNNLEAPAMVQIAEQSSDPFKENISPERAKGACVLLDLSTAEPDPSGWYASDAPCQTHEAGFLARLEQAEQRDAVLLSRQREAPSPNLAPTGWETSSDEDGSMEVKQKKKPKKRGKSKTAKKIKKQDGQRCMMTTSLGAESDPAFLRHCQDHILSRAYPDYY